MSGLMPIIFGQAARTGAAAGKGVISYEYEDGKFIEAEFDHLPPPKEDDSKDKREARLRYLDSVIKVKSRLQIGIPFNFPDEGGLTRSALPLAEKESSILGLRFNFGDPDNPVSILGRENSIFSNKGFEWFELSATHGAGFAMGPWSEDRDGAYHANGSLGLIPRLRLGPAFVEGYLYGSAEGDQYNYPTRLHFNGSSANGLAGGGIGGYIQDNSKFRLSLKGSAHGSFGIKNYEEGLLPLNSETSSVLWIGGEFKLEFNKKEEGATIEWDYVRLKLSGTPSAGTIVYDPKEDITTRPYEDLTGVRLDASGCDTINDDWRVCGAVGFSRYRQGDHDPIVKFYVSPAVTRKNIGTFGLAYELTGNSTLYPGLNKGVTEHIFSINYSDPSGIFSVQGTNQIFAGERLGVILQAAVDPIKGIITLTQ